MKARITLDKHGSQSTNDDALATVIRELGSKATIQGNEVTVDDWDKMKVIDTLTRKGVTKYEVTQTW
ncbi:MAG: hypothetical protein HY720_12695 [Planctomycetes bacterium]|nr:hypothetical protein [Planctomycetota bacterium]